MTTPHPSVDKIEAAALERPPQRALRHPRDGNVTSRHNLLGFMKSDLYEVLVHETLIFVTPWRCADATRGEVLMRHLKRAPTRGLR